MFADFNDLDRGSRGTWSKLHDRLDGFALIFVGYAHHCAVLHRRVRNGRLLDFGRVDIEPAGDDEGL